MKMLDISLLEDFRLTLYTISLIHFNLDHISGVPEKQCPQIRGSQSVEDTYDLSVIIRILRCIGPRCHP